MRPYGRTSFWKRWCQCCRYPKWKELPDRRAFKRKARREARREIAAQVQEAA